MLYLLKHLHPHPIQNPSPFVESHDAGSPSMIKPSMFKFKEINSEDIKRTLDCLEGKSTYPIPRYNLFWDEIRKMGKTPYHYEGRYYYEGPAVNVDDDDEKQEVIRATSMPLQWDNLGLGWVVYPK